MKSMEKLVAQQYTRNNEKLKKGMKNYSGARSYLVLP
jgi:hypothetical protein